MSQTPLANSNNHRTPPPPQKSFPDPCKEYNDIKLKEYQ